MKVYDVLAAMEKIAPFELCADWDNSGLLVGDGNAEVTKTYVCLDVTPETAEDAISRGCNLIVAHHPVIFGGVKRITNNDFIGRLLLQLIGNGVNVIAAHTNFDNAGRGVNYVLANALGLQDIRKLSEGNDNPSYIGELPKAVSGRELADMIKKALCLDVVRAAGLDTEKEYRTVAVCGGAGADLWADAMAAGADVLISGDGKHHVGLESAAAGIAVFDGNHFHTENLAMAYLEKYLNEMLPSMPTVLSDINTCPWQNY